jgi:prevent-host-death family protein
MKIVGACEARNQLPKLLRMVTRGEKVVITKHGVPLAVLQQFKNVQKKDFRKTIAELKIFRQAHNLRGLAIKDMIQEGRR